METIAKCRNSEFNLREITPPKNANLAMQIFALDVDSRSHGRQPLEKPIASATFEKKLVPLEKKSVLIVDDSPDMLRLHKLILELEGYTVFTASSGNQALKVLDEISEPGLILLDMCMDDMSGSQFLEVLENLRPKTFENVPVVFLTGVSEIPKGKHKGFLRKPIDNDKMVETVHSFIDRQTRPRCLEH